MNDQTTGQTDMPLPAAEMLAIADREHSTAKQLLQPDDRVFYGVWGVAWTVGFFALWATHGDSPPVGSRTAAGWLFAVLMVTAFGVTVRHTARRVAGVRGASEALGRRYGIAWGVAFATYPMFLYGLDRADAPDAVAGLVAALMPCFIVGLLYMAGGAAWHDDLQFGLGAWLTLATGAAAMVGSPGHELVMSIGGGGGLLCGAVLASRRRRAAS